MITALDTLGPAIWRASWQAAALALLVVLVLRCCGERLSPRWRFLIWGVVLTRLLCVVTPVSPWSVFNLVPRYAETVAEPIAHRDAEAILISAPHRLATPAQTPPPPGGPHQPAASTRTPPPPGRPHRTRKRRRIWAT